MICCSLLFGALTPVLTNIQQLHAQTPYLDQPDWESQPNGLHSVGVALADINRDGFLDLIVSNGADSGREPIVVHYNLGNGLLETTPSWQSADSAFHGNLAVGDIDHDGWPDVAVSVLFNNDVYADSGHVKLYLNINGRLEETPSWRSADTFNSYACAFGDPDGDGDLDLTAMAGEPVTEKRDRSRIYYNDNGRLQDTPGWQHELLYLGGDATWADFDRDGIAEPAMVYHLEPNRIFGNDGTKINERYKWFSQDRAFYARDVYSADMDNDGWLDLLVANGGYAGGAGYIKLYRNEAENGMGRTPHWRSAVLDVNTSVRSYDFDGDGFRDIIATAWDRGLLTWRSNEGQFSDAPSWESHRRAVNESLALGDLDNAALRVDSYEFAVGPQGRSFFALGNAPFRNVENITFGGVELAYEDFCFQGEQGWLSIDRRLHSDTLRVRVRRSTQLDAVVAVWNADQGNIVYNFDPVRVDVAESAAPKNSITLRPLPAKDRLYLGFPRWGFSSLSMFVAEWEVYDLLGRKLLEGRESLSAQQAGLEIKIDALEAGSYIVRVRAGSREFSAGFVVAK